MRHLYDLYSIFYVVFIVQFQQWNSIEVKASEQHTNKYDSVHSSSVFESL